MTGNANQERTNQRARRLRDITRDCVLAADFPLLKVVTVPEFAFSELRGSVIAYLWQSLTSWHGGRGFEVSPSILTDYAEAVLSLPNRTPNGILMPRRETFLAFNMVQRGLCRVFEELNLTRHFSHLQDPCNIRIVSGVVNSDVDARPYSSAKMHTDIWVAEPHNSIPFNIPILGDPAAVAMAFYEPKDVDIDFYGVKDDYGDADLDGADIETYDTPFELGHLYVSDPYSLHRTVKNGPGIRLSIDLRCIARVALDHENAYRSNGRTNYTESDVWTASGSSIILASGMPIDAFSRLKAGERLKPTTIGLREFNDIEL